MDLLEFDRIHEEKKLILRTRFSKPIFQGVEFFVDVVCGVMLMGFRLVRDLPYIGKTLLLQHFFILRDIVDASTLILSFLGVFFVLFQTSSLYF